MFPEGLLERKRFDKRPVEPIIVAQKYAQFDVKFSVPLESCLNSNLTEIHFCKGRGCLFFTRSEVCQRKSNLLIFKKDIAKRLWPLQAFIQPLGGIGTCTPEQLPVVKEGSEAFNGYSWQFDS